MFLFPVFDFVAKNKWAQYLLLALAIIATLGGYLLLRDEGVKRRERERWLRKQAQEAAKVSETRRGIEETRTNDIIQADRAADALPRFDSVDQLREQRPDLYAELFGDPAAGSGEAKGR
jgi:uncharacterized protein HemX